MTKTLPQFIKENRIRITSEMIYERPDSLMNDMPTGSTHWKVVLFCKNKQMTIYYSQGPAICKEPKTNDILSCIISDASIAENCEDAADVMIEFGYNDPKQARAIYKACQKTHADLLRILGHAKLSEVLYEVESE